MVDNASLEEKHQDFREYEQRARKTLQAFEASLLGREKTLQQRESLRPSQSLLPSE